MKIAGLHADAGSSSNNDATRDLGSAYLRSDGLNQTDMTTYGGDSAC